MPSVGLVIIGNEILTGKVHDQNTPFLARRLYELGAELRRVEVVSDEVEEVGRAVASASRAFDLVVTSGGVGPTHDDVTLAGVAHGLGTELEALPELEALVRAYYKVERLTEVQARMTRVPAGSKLIYPRGRRFPQLVVGNVYIFPGVPELLREKFEAVADHFAGIPFHLEKLKLVAQEADIALILEQAVERFPDLRLGSYPYAEEEVWKVELTLESRSREEVLEALDFLTRALQG